MAIRNILIVIISLLALTVASGCAYRSTVSQGNLIDQEDVDQVELGMTKNQIRFLLGTPMIDDPFNAERWDYVYFIKIGRKDAAQKRWISIVFEDELVSEILLDRELSQKL